MAFWGLVLEPKKTYTQREVEQPFHISMAALDVQSSDSNEHTTVVCRKRDQDFILCNLSKKQGVVNVPLNLDFELGAEINFHVLGSSSVHLTGYIIEDIESFEDSDESGEEEEEEEEEEADNDVVLKNTKKQLDAIKRKEHNAPQNKSKKAKLEVPVEEEEDEDDSDFDMDESDDIEEEEVEEEEDDDEDIDAEEDEEPTAPKDQGKKDKSKQQPKNQQANATPKGQKQDQKQQKQQKNQPKGQTPQSNKSNGQPQANGPRKQSGFGGVIMEDLQVGNGPVAKNGKAVSVYYVGRLKATNKQFDATTSGAGFAFRLGRGEVIKGWDVGVVGMRVGGKRRITIPPKMAYGSTGAGSAVPPNSTLVFEVELRKVK